MISPNNSNLSSKFSFLLAHFALTNDFVSSQDKTLYYSANLGATVYQENLLVDTFFKTKTSTPLNDVSFEQWKQVKQSNPGQSQNQNTPTPTKLKQEVQKENPVQTTALDSLAQVSSLENATGFTNLPLELTGEAVALGLRSGIGLSESASFTLAPMTLQHIFKADKSNPNFSDSTKYATSNGQRAYSSGTDAQGDAEFARIHSPTFYLKFLLEKSTQFPLVLLARGNVQKANGLAVVLHQDTHGSSLTVNRDSTFFRAIVFFSDKKGKLFNFETDFIFQTDKTHSLSLSIFQFFGQFAQLVLTFDDGTYFKSSSLIRNFLFENTLEPLKLFPKDKTLFDALEAELANSGSKTPASSTSNSVNSPGFGSILFRLAVLNSGAGFLSNVVFGNNIDFLKNCLSTCPLSFSFQVTKFRPQASSGAASDMSLVSVGYSSDACFTCTSLNPTFNMSSGSQSLFPTRPNWSFNMSRQQRSNW